MKAWGCSCVSSSPGSVREVRPAKDTTRTHQAGERTLSRVGGLPGSRCPVRMSAPVRSLSLVTLLALLLAVPARAAIERVRITRASEDEITVQRANGDLWRLGLDRQCPELSAAWGRVLIQY